MEKWKRSHALLTQNSVHKGNSDAIPTIAVQVWEKHIREAVRSEA
jgi:hypothetical protein